jgi:HK97 gp10 family phage protein
MSVTTVGFKEFRNKLNSLPKDIQEEVDGFVLDAAQQWEERAKLDAPVDKGFLRSGITSKFTGRMSAEVYSNEEYSPYVEWGTGTRVKVPADLQKYAIQFKGKKQTIGRYPHPYFFIQRPIIEKSLYGDIIKMLSTPR